MTELKPRPPTIIQFLIARGSRSKHIHAKNCDQLSYECVKLRKAAAYWADHPDYQAKWKL